MGMPEMMNYQEMSDEQIDLAVSEIIFGNKLGRRVNYSFDRPKFFFHRVWSLTSLDNEKIIFTPRIKPTSSWAHAGPIIQESKIAIREYDGWWEARSYIPEYAYRQKNPLRAAMVVFLMMKGGE